MPCGPIAQAWQQHLDTEEVVRYILLLDEPDAAGGVLPCAYCPKFSVPNNVSYVLDTAQYLSTSKLILELLIPKLRDLLQSWSNYASDRSSSVSSDTYRRAVNACMAMHLFIPHFADTTSPQLEIFEADLRSLEVQLIQELRESSLGYQPLMEALMQSIQPYLPACDSSAFRELAEKAPSLLRFFTLIADEFNRYRLRRTALETDDTDDLMDLDENFSTQQRQTKTDGLSLALPRKNFELEMSASAFYVATTQHLTLLAMIRGSQG